MDKNSIAEILNEIGVLLELKGENAFKIRAYQSGARALESLDEDISDVVNEGRLNSIKGIGKALAEKIETLHRSGKLEYYDKLRSSIPKGLIEMLEIAGVGAKKIRAVHESLGIDSISELERACREERIANLPGFGAKSQERILTGIRNREIYSKRHIWWDARSVSQPILDGLRKLPEVVRAEHAGSLRRGCETVGDLDFIVASSNPGPIMEWFTEQGGIAEVSAKGETKSSVRLEGGIQADLRVVPEEQFYFALHHFTGSKDHNVLMRQRAISRGYSLSEWGITERSESSSLRCAEPGSDGEGEGDGEGKELNKIRSEKDLFGFLGLAYIMPELREGLDEIEEAEKLGMPNLVKEEDIRGVFHNHTTASDGHNTLEEMAEAAENLGWEYLGIADHSKASFQANGLDEERLSSQIRQIERLKQSGRFQIRIFSGVECDILPNGDLDLADAVLEELDYVVVSVHSSFSQSEEEMTARIIRAIEHPCSTMLAHLTGRILLRREGYRVNEEKVIDAAIANKKIIELNANPHRLDMDWRLWKKAAAKGLMCAINPDAHSTGGLEYFRAGVLAARKGWLTAADILNTSELERVEAYFASR